ncbi:pinin/SDK/memA/ protein conserved region-domain-containing protein [Coniella lustricola]|uniref:Pinin/SDK/memA/ protein conserved region-domain-containing protein n=1 Tax=Coniella lustricola TaxID=2025994 RepID=A0A2T3AF77_9PEZI|nr:pinin/SDK/memA/ protein conserved region-domain-containing protein [Coniella lustricola]
MPQLKRKSLDGLPYPDHNGNDDAPNKRVRVEETSGALGIVEDADKQSTHVAHQSAGGWDTESTAQDVFVDGTGASDGARQPTRAEAEGIPDMERPDMEKRMLDDAPDKATSPSKDRPQHDIGRRRSPSPSSMRSRDPHSGTYDSRRRDPSPPLPRSRDRRVSETSRRRPDVTLGDKDRPQREGLNKEEEKKRGKRLFGGLLSTLSQSSTNSQQRKRQEIEKRQQEKAAKQRSEDDKRRSGKLQKLDRIRKIEQVCFDEQVMRTRHSNMLARAHSLQTRSRPKLYYRPWELTQDQEHIIKEQIRDVQATIEDELEQFKRQKEQRLKDLGASTAVSKPIVTTDELVVESAPSGTGVKVESNATVANDQKESSAPKQEPQSSIHEERDHDEMVEADEDTVIY